ncbi:hypothetical protein [Actinomadura sp. NPDC049753]|uniref:hypothetical protein n=1 Tax=Actinomadura sp. NPDC049753 TaxID=3154739 RepID=UPI00342EE8A2
MTGSPYNAVHIEGGLLSADLIERIRSAARDLPGNRPEDYHLAAGERLGEAASRKWDYLKGAYRAFRERLDALPPTDSAVTETRERWLLRLFDELGFGRLTFLRGGITVGEKTYPVSHQWGEHVAVHLLGWNTDLDRRTKAHGQTGRAPQSMLQEFLNASDPHLWAVLSNGRVLRILLTRPRSSGRRTCSSTWKPSSTATCTRSSCSSSRSCTRPGSSCCPATTAESRPSPTAGSNAGALTESTPAAAHASNCGSTSSLP